MTDEKKLTDEEIRKAVFCYRKSSINRLNELIGPVQGARIKPNGELENYYSDAFSLKHIGE